MVHLRRTTHTLERLSLTCVTQMAIKTTVAGIANGLIRTGTLQRITPSISRYIVEIETGRERARAAGRLRGNDVVVHIISIRLEQELH